MPKERFVGWTLHLLNSYSFKETSKALYKIFWDNKSSDNLNNNLDLDCIFQKVLLDNLELDHLKLDNKVRFILGVVNGEIIVSNRKRAELFMELHQKGFTPFPKKGKGPDVSVAGATGDDEEENQSLEAEVSIKGGVKASDYEYLLSMAIGTLTLEKVQELCAEKDKLEDAVTELRKASPKSLWEKDLDALEKELDVSSICGSHLSLHRIIFHSPCI